MKGVVAFLPIDLARFDELIAPLLAGRKVNPEDYLNRALRTRQTYRQARRHANGLDMLLAESEPPELEQGATFLRKVKFHLEKLDHEVDELHRRARELVDADLLLEGRPFFITDGSANGVADRVDAYNQAVTPEDVDRVASEQMRKLDEKLAGGVEPGDALDVSADLTYRADLLKALKDVYDIAQAARTDESWSGGPRGGRRPGAEVLVDEVPWRAIWIHSRAVPFWIGYDVDGLETVCRAAGVVPPDVLVPAWRPFAEACEEFPDLKETLHLELRGARDVGAFVSPSDVPALLEFLTTEGARIIRIATQHGEGRACTTLLKKIRECATYAAKHGMGYLEASGIQPPDLPDEDDS